MAAIFIGSTNLLSSGQTSRFLKPALLWLIPTLSDESIKVIQFIIRKCGHITEYAVLAMLLWRAVKQPNSNWVPRRFSPSAAAFGIATLYALSDEYHQSLVATRMGSVWDVLIDMTGAGLGLLLLHALQKRRIHSRP